MKKKNKNIAGKIITVLQLIVSVICIVVAKNSGLFPRKYLTLFIVGLGFLFVLTHVFQYPKSKILRYVGMLTSLVIIIVLAGISVELMKADDFIKKVGGASYKTDNMIVVVKKEDTAKDIMDAQDYRFGYQTIVDVDNTEKMLKDIRSTVGRNIKTEEYSTLIDEANALLNGNIDAAVFNEGYLSIIDDSVEGFSDQVKILYQYGIKTKVENDTVADVNKPFNIYISGIDVSGPISTNSRSDVNLIMTVNPQNKKILLTTTPRDYYVTIPNVSGEKKDKLTHAGIYGVDASMDTLEQLYGININYYARINFTSLVKIVDALGGIDVNSDYEFKTTHGEYDIQKGMNHLDGKMALGFVRERYSFEDGDNQRGKNQEKVLTAIIQKACTPAILKNAGEVITGVSDSVQTNMSSEEIAKFINAQIFVVLNTAVYFYCYQWGTGLGCSTQKDEWSLQKELCKTVKKELAVNQYIDDNTLKEMNHFYFSQCIASLERTVIEKDQTNKNRILSDPYFMKVLQVEKEEQRIHKIDYWLLKRKWIDLYYGLHKRYAKLKKYK